MSDAGWDRVRRLFEAAIDRPAAERHAFLDEVCGGDRALREQVDRLLAADAKSVAGAIEGGIAPFVAEAVPTSIGRYRIVRVVGEGGMGRVFVAEQREPVQRRVALKLIKVGMDTARVLERFDLERRALARMDHDNIARIFDAGATESGQPYFVMEYVDGEPLRAYCERRGLDVRARIALVQQVCAGVQHAHQKGLIHRDLKPSNILVAEQTGRAVPKIIDFGIAKATGPDTAQFTELGEVIGTPDYMSPEQAAADDDVDTRTDVYSLGVILYELLTGALPFERKGEHSHVTRPSARVRELRGDLDWILLKALDADRERRYATPKELSDDLARHLRSEPVEAGPPGALYRMGKFVRRNRVQVIASAAVFASLVAGIVGTTVYLFEAREKADEAATHLDRFNLLANVLHLEDARAIYDDPVALYPAWPSKAPALRAWIAEHGEPMRRALPGVRSALEGMPVRTQADRFLRDALQKLVADLDAFAVADAGALTRVRERLSWAESVQRRTIDAHATRWAEARKAIATSVPYRACRIDLTPQLGLVPIGANPVTGLWEFYHPRSAADPDALPRHDARGRIAIGDDTGIVFVLVPGMPFAMGSQATDPDAPYYDPETKPHETQHDVDLAPFLIARHELTQGQWMRMSDGTNPSSHGPPWDRPDDKAAPVTPRHPVENVSFDMCTRLLRQHGLELPSEEQWEFACRAGTTTPWFTGTTPESLLGYANILDKTAGRAVAQWGEPSSIDDGFISHAPVGTFKPNAYGLFDTHGNVWEWCRGQAGSTNRHIVRGGGFTGDAMDARTSIRLAARPNIRSLAFGVRPVRSIRR